MTVFPGAENRLKRYIDLKSDSGACKIIMESYLFVLSVQFKEWEKDYDEKRILRTL